MSSTVSDHCCKECNSTNAYSEVFNDDEVGTIEGCFDCGYYEVYREDYETGEIIEDYQGYDHHYAKEDKLNQE